MSYLVLEEVSKSFGEILAVDGVSLEVTEGEFLSLLGPSGCGKSTTLRLIAGLERADGGRIRLQGEVINDIPTHQRNIGMVFQNYALFPHMDIFENLVFGLRMRKVERGKWERRAREILDLVKLPGFERRRSNQLSGGQQQRIALARALIIQPAVLLLDEPLGALDKKLRVQMQTELKELQRELKITTIFVTHDQEEALTMSDRIAVMEGGRIEQVGTPAQIYERPETHFVADFIGSSNFFSGKVRSIVAGEMSVTAGPLEIWVPARHGLKVGSPVELSVRPEKIRLGRGGKNSFSGRVARAKYFGTYTQLDVLLDGESLVMVYISRDEGGVLREEARGREVFVSWDAEDTLVLEKGA